MNDLRKSVKDIIEDSSETKSWGLSSSQADRLEHLIVRSYIRGILDCGMDKNLFNLAMDGSDENHLYNH